jgi:hypothetical protein
VRLLNHPAPAAARNPAIQPLNAVHLDSGSMRSLVIGPAKGIGIAPE